MCMTGITEIDLATARIGQTMTAGAGRHHAIKHVNTADNSMNKVVRCADAHQIMRGISRQNRHSKIKHAQHFIMPLAHGQATYGITVKANIDKRCRAFVAQIFVNAALNNTEQRVAFSGIVFFESGFRPCRPARRQMH